MDSKTDPWLLKYSAIWDKKRHQWENYELGHMSGISSQSRLSAVNIYVSIMNKTHTSR